MNPVKRAQSFKLILCYFFAFACLFIINFSANISNLSAKEPEPENERMFLAQLAKARNFIVSYNNDSAKLLLRPLIPLLNILCIGFSGFQAPFELSVL